MSNQEAIALLRNLEDSLDAYCELNEEGKTAFRMAIEALSCSEFPNNSDTISRRQAIDAIGEKNDEIFKTKQKGATYPHDDFFQGMAYAENVVKQLPSAQPEIIRCRECKFASGDSRICMKFDHSPIGELDFCSFAERREVTT